MSDAHNERKLTDILQEIGGMDLKMEIPTGSLQRRMAAMPLQKAGTARPAWLALAAAVIALAAAASLPLFTPRLQIVPVPSQPSGKFSEPERVISEVETQPAAAVNPAPRTRNQAPGSQRQAASVPRPRAVSFTPLFPLSAQELGGSFQMVRVRMPSPYGTEPVQADVLIGEDGLARAIRVSADDVDFFGRSR